MGDSRGMRKNQETGLSVPIVFCAFAPLVPPFCGMRKEMALRSSLLFISK